MLEYQTKSEQKELFISRIFEAEPALVFKAWTDPQLLTQWYAPRGCTITLKCMEVKKGGILHSCIHDPVHGDCWIKGVYNDIIFPSKLQFTMMLSNEEGDPVESVASGKPEDWPGEILTTITFTPLGDKTRLTLHQTVLERKARETGAYQSWINMLEKLDKLIKAGAQ